MLSVVLTADVPEGSDQALRRCTCASGDSGKALSRAAVHAKSPGLRAFWAPSHIPALVWLPSLACQFHNPVPFLMVPSRGNMRGVQYWGAQNEAGDQGGSQTEGLTCKRPAQARPLIHVRSLPLPRGSLGSLCAK